LVSPAMREQLRPARHHGDQQVERVGRGGGADNPDRAIGSLLLHGDSIYIVHISCSGFATDFGRERSCAVPSTDACTNFSRLPANSRSLDSSLRSSLPMNKSMPAPEEQRVHSRTLWLGDAGGFPCACGGAALLGQRCSRRTALPCSADETECAPVCEQ